MRIIRRVLINRMNGDSEMFVHRRRARAQFDRFGQSQILKMNGRIDVGDVSLQHKIQKIFLILGG